MGLGAYVAGLSGGIPGMGCSCQEPKTGLGMPGFFPKSPPSGQHFNKYATAGLGAVVQSGGAWIDQDTGRAVAPYGTGLWLDPQTGVVMGQDGRIVTNVQTDPNAGDTVARLLAIPGQVTGAVGLTPAQAVQLGLQVSGHAPVATQQPAGASSGPSAGTVALVLLGLGAGGLALGAASRRKVA